MKPKIYIDGKEGTTPPVKSILSGCRDPYLRFRAAA